MNIDYSYNKIVTSSGYNYENQKINTLNENIIKLGQNFESVHEALAKIYATVKFTFILILIVSLAFSIWR